MAYSETACALRRCQAHTKDGRPCSNFAAWDDPLRRCGAHGGRVIGPHVPQKTHAPPCTCEAWPFPHRPGADPCRWPDPPRQRVLMRTSSERKTCADRAEKRTLRSLTRLPGALFGYQLQQSYERERRCVERLMQARQARQRRQKAGQQGQ